MNHCQINRALFSIKEMSNICGISRTSLLRLEEDGFLTPYHVNHETGYRYYDLLNVTAGYRMHGSEPLMSIYDNFEDCVDPIGSNKKRTLCIPVISDSKNDPNLRFFLQSRRYPSSDSADMKYLQNSGHAYLMKPGNADRSLRDIRDSFP